MYLEENNNHIAYINAVTQLNV